MDENGYPIDTSELDNDEVNFQKINIPKMTQTLSTTSPSVESHQETVDTTTKNGQDKNDDEDDSLNEQGGSPSSSWFSSSVTGLLELVQKDDSASSPKEEKTEKIGDSSFTSSVTGWLGFVEEINDESHNQAKEQDTGTLASTMTGWLGFGSDTKVSGNGQEEREKETKEENKPVEIFRSRKIALNLEGNQFNEEENKEIGTLGWLGNGISSTLGFGLTNEDLKHKAKSEEPLKELNPVSSSWYDIGITDMLGFRNEHVAKETGNDNMEKGSSSAEQTTDAILPSPSNNKISEQPELKDEETLQKVVDTSISTSFDTVNGNNEDKTFLSNSVTQYNTDSHSKPAEENFQEDGSSQTTYKNIEFIQNIATEEDQTEGHTPDSQKDNLINENDSKLNVTETELENNAEERNHESDNDSENSNMTETEELQMNRSLEIEEESGAKNQGDKVDEMKENEIQEAFNERQDMSEEVIQLRQAVVHKKELKEELHDEDDLKEDERQKQEAAEKVQENEGEEKLDYDEDLELGKGQNDVVEIKEGESEEKKQEVVGEAHKEVEEIKKEEWQVDEVKEAGHQEDIEGIAEVEKHKVVDVVEKDNNEENMDMILEVIPNNAKDALDEENENAEEKLREDKNQIAMEEVIEDEMQHKDVVENSKQNRKQEEVNNVELEKALTNDYADSKNEQENNREEIEVQKDTEENVFEDINLYSRLRSDLSIAIELSDQIADESDQQLNLETLAINENKGHDAEVNTDAYELIDNDINTDVFKAADKTEFAGSLKNNVLNETFTSVSHEPAASSADDHKKDSKNAEAYRPFHDPFSFFSNTSNSQTTEYGLSSETDTVGTTQSQADIKTEEETNPMSDSKDVSVQDSQTISPMIQSLSGTSTTVTVTFNPKTLHKHYRNILIYMNVDEAAILIHHFGEHKLQFLDYLLGSLTTASDEPETDKSILLDIERLLHYHMETMMVPSKRLADTPQEDKDNTSIFIALQKLEIVLGKVKESFNTSKSDFKEENKQGSFMLYL